MKAAVLTLLFATLVLPVVAGPPTFIVESLSASVAGRYSYQPPNQPAVRGILELQLKFAPRPEFINVVPTFGDTDYSVSTVTFTIDGKPQVFPTELLKHLGYCSPTSILFWPDGNPAGLLMIIDFSTGADKKALVFRVRQNSIRSEESK